MRSAEYDRDAVLRNAMEAFRAKGYAKTTMQELVAATGLHLSLIHIYIANAYRRMGLYERAESYFNELEHDYRQLGDEEHLVDIHSQQGLLYICLLYTSRCV